MINQYLPHVSMNNTIKNNKQSFQKQQEINNSYLQYTQYSQYTNQKFHFKYRQSYNHQRISLLNRLSQYFKNIAILIVLTLITYILFIYQAIVNYLQLKKQNQNFNMLLNINQCLFILLHFFFILSIVSYIQMIITSPGIQVQTTKQQAYQFSLKLNNVQSTKYCKYCNLCQLPQTQHNGDCCILQNEQSVCIGNTIGKFNLKFYLLYYLYNILTLSIAFIHIIFRLVFMISITNKLFNQYSYKERLISIFHILGIIIFELIIILLIFINSGLLYLFIKCKINRMTLSEQMKYQTIFTEYQYQIIKFRIKKYSSKMQNLKRVFGKNFLIWVIPVSNSIFQDIQQKIKICIGYKKQQYNGFDINYQINR